MKRAVLVPLLILLALCSGFLAAHWQRQATKAPQIDGTVFAPARRLPEFQLLASNGGDFTPADLKGRWNLLYFGYSHCQNRCGETLDLLNRVVERLGLQAPQIDFVSLDPLRDTPDRLARYLAGFNTNFVGVTGADSAISALAQALQVEFDYQPERNGAYRIHHSNQLLLVDLDGQIRALFTPPYDATALARDIRAVEAHYGD